MNDKNFDSFKNLKAPQEWIENAINIPETTNKAKPIIFVKFSRYIATAACLVLVCALSLTFYFTHKNATPPAAHAPQNTDSTSDFSNNEDANADYTQSPSQNSNNHDNHGVVISPPSDGTNGDAPLENPSENTKPTKPGDKPIIGPTRPSENIEPTEKPTHTPTEDKTQSPTTKPTQRPTVKPTTPTQKPKPTVPQPPTDNDPPAAPPGSNPGNPGAPGAPGASAPFYTKFSVSVDISYVTSGEKIYCTIIDPNGYTVSEYTSAYVYKSGNSAYAMHELYSGTLSTSGNYTCYFFSEKGYTVGTDTAYIKI